MARLIVDGMNVIGAVPDRWWLDRDGAVRRLLTALEKLAAEAGDEITLVLDGPPLHDVAEGKHDGVDVRYARRVGRNGADDRIVELVAHDADASTLIVVTSDRNLGARVRALGAKVIGARKLRDRLDRLEPRAR